MDNSAVASLIRAIPTALMLVDPEERVIAANAGAEALFGTSLSGRPCTTFLRHPSFLAALETALVQGMASECRISLAGKTVDTVLAVHVAPYAFEGSGCALVTFEDQTAFEQAVAMRRDFVANVSHELRTPLTALVGFIDTLRGAAREDAVARERFLGIMAREAGRMIRLVNDLLSLGRVEAAERQRPSEVVELVGLLQNAIATHEEEAVRSSVRLLFSSTVPEARVPGDADQLLQVFHNLIENALKYGGADRDVTIRVQRIAREPALRGAAVQVEVADQGEGIEAIHLPRLTERFYRVDTGRSREKGGTGLGLAIVKHIVNRHRGRLKIESEVGKGSRFIVLLPET